MIVEFIGSTGAGKTTLLRAVQRRLAETTLVTDSTNLATSRLGLQGVTNPTVQNLIQELVSLPFFFRSLPRYKAFIAYTIRMFSRNSDFSMATLNNLRSLERKIGVHEIARRHTHEQIILVDEGPILAAHMFAFTRTSLTFDEIAQFANLVPLPDLVVYVRAPREVVVKRTLHRLDPPRQMNSKGPALTESYVQRAAAIFDQLVEAEPIRCRSLIVDNRDFAEQEYNALIDDIAGHILKWRLPC
jgi:thymidylate kinase